MPACIVFAPGDKIAYVANWRDNNVGVVDIFSHRQTKAIPVGLSPLGMALTANGRLLVVCNSENDLLSAIDTDTLEVTATIPLDAYPRYVAILE